MFRQVTVKFVNGIFVLFMVFVVKYGMFVWKWRADSSIAQYWYQMVFLLYFNSL